MNGYVLVDILGAIFSHINVAQVLDGRRVGFSSMPEPPAPGDPAIIQSDTIKAELADPNSIAIDFLCVSDSDGEAI